MPYRKLIPVEFKIFFNSLPISLDLRMVPACACDSKTIIDDNSRLMLVERCERAAICSSSSNTNSNSSGVRSCELRKKKKF